MSYSYSICQLRPPCVRTPRCRRSWWERTSSVAHLAGRTVSRAETRYRSTDRRGGGPEMPTPTMDPALARTPEHRTVSRVMAILEVVVASEPNGLRLADLPDMVGAPKSTIHGLARGLVATGYIREQNGRYFQGPALAMLA